jgi:hypothetical protein
MKCTSSGRAWVNPKGYPAARPGNNVLPSRSEETRANGRFSPVNRFQDAPSQAQLEIHSTYLFIVLDPQV